MASSGNIERKVAGSTTTAANGYFIGIDWKVDSQSTSSVSSTVVASVYVRSNGSGYQIDSTSTKNISLKINGTTYTGTNTIGIGQNKKKVLLTKTVSVPHNSDGTKTCSFEGMVQFSFTLSGTYLGNETFSGTGTFDKINVNSAPTMSGYVGVSPSGTIAENVSTLALSWSKASDSQNNADKYQIYRYINGTHNKTINISNVNTLSYNDTDLGSFGEGTKIDYTLWAGDTFGAWSNAIYSYSVYKNSLTAATVASTTSKITSSFATVPFTWSGAKNTYTGANSTSFDYTLTADGITIYNNTSTGSSMNVAIVDNSTTGPYIKKADLINKFKGSNLTGNLTFTLRTANKFGSSKTTSKTISVDLKSEPTGATPVISEDPSLSTALKTVASVSKNKYFLPNGTDKIRITWSGAYDVLGQPITYDIQIKLGNGGYETKATNLTGNYYDLVLPKQTVKQQIVARVITKTNYGYSKTVDSSAKTLDYYNAPSVDIIKVDRTDTTATARVKLKANTSIPNINFPTRTYSGASSGTLTNTVAEQSITASNLNGGNKYSWTITINDDTGFTTVNQTRAIEIPAYTPLFSVREKGVGVNAIPDGSAALMVNGKAKVDGGIVYHTLNKPSASDIGARPSNWMPTAAEVGARPSNWTPTWNDVSSKPTVFDMWNDNWQRRSGQYSYLYHMSSKENGTLVIAPSTVKEGTTADWDKEYNFYQNGVFNAKYIQARQDLRVGVNTSTGGTIYPFNWSGSWLSGKSQGGIVFGKQSTGSYHSNLLFHASSDDKVSIGGLGTHVGFNMYRKEETNNTVNQYFRLNCQDELMECSMPIMYRSARLWTGSLGSGGGSLTLSNGMKYASINIGARPGGSGDVFTSIATGLLTTTVAYYQITNEAQYLKFAIRADGNNIIMSWNAGTSGSVIKSVYGV